MQVTSMGTAAFGLPGGARHQGRSRLIQTITAAVILAMLMVTLPLRTGPGTRSTTPFGGLASKTGSLITAVANTTAEGAEVIAGAAQVALQDGVARVTESLRSANSVVNQVHLPVADLIAVPADWVQSGLAKIRMAATRSFSNTPGKGPVRRSDGGGQKVPRRIVGGTVAGVAAMGLTEGTASAGQSPLATTTVDINPGTVTTFAGNGNNATVDGTGSGASFGSMNNSVVVGTSAYVATYSSIRAVNLSTAVVTTFAGSTYGCSDNTDPSLAAFANPTDITTDGTYLYVLDQGCGIRKVALSGGSTSTLPGGIYASSITFAGSSLYATGNGTVLEVNPTSGATTTFATLPGAGTITSDGTDLWATGCTVSVCGQLFRIPLSTGTPAAVGTTTLGSFLTSAGSYLYSRLGSSNVVVRVSKTDGAVANIAGVTASGYADGTSTDAWFADPRGLSS